MNTSPSFTEDSYRFVIGLSPIYLCIGQQQRFGYGKEQGGGCVQPGKLLHIIVRFSGFSGVEIVKYCKSQSESLVSIIDVANGSVVNFIDVANGS